MIKLIIPLLKAPSTIIKHRKMYACNHSGFLFRNNNLQDYTTNEDDEINKAKTRIDVYLLPTIAISISITRLAYLINH